MKTKKHSVDVDIPCGYTCCFERTIPGATDSCCPFCDGYNCNCPGIEHVGLDTSLAYNDFDDVNIYWPLRTAECREKFGVGDE